MSSFSEGVTLEQYDPNTQILQIADAPAAKGTYLQVRRDIYGVIRLRTKLVLN